MLLNADSAPFLNQEIRVTHFRNQTSPDPKPLDIIASRQFYNKSSPKNIVEKLISNLDEEESELESKYTGKFKVSIHEENPDMLLE